MSSTRESRPIDWSKYPIRTCQSLHCCDVCSKSITLGQQYRDGGYGRRAHVACLQGDDPSRCIEIEIPGDGMMGRVPHDSPATVSEWIAQTEETGIIDFEKLKAITDKLQADLARKDQAIMTAHEALFWHDRSTVREAFDPLDTELRLGKESTTRGWMGGGTVGGGDPDDADRAPECEVCRGSEQPCAKCIPPTPYLEAFAKPIPMLPMTEAARLKAKEAIRKLRERDNEIMLDAVADNYVRGREDERERIIAYYTELFQRAPFSVSDMLSDIRRNQHHKPGEP